jgi:hypothetical protein
MLFNETLSVRTPWRYRSCRTLAASHILCEVSWQQIFTGWGCQPRAQPPTWRTRVSLLIWHLPRNLSAMDGPTSSYAAAGIALEFIGAHKPPHTATQCFRQGGDTIKGDLFSNSDYIAFNEMVISEWWILKDMEGSVRGRILRYYPGIRLGGLKKATKKMSGQPVSGLRFEPLICRIRSRSVGAVE